MIVLDTNVVSELSRPTPSQAVIEWVDTQDSSNLATRNTADFSDTGIQLINPWDNR